MATSPHHLRPEEVAARQAVMALCADASRDDLDAALQALEAPAAEDLRPPETGLVMATGRIGGDGRPFNLGEVSVTRAAIRLPDGATGFAYHLGRDRTKARLAATLDALWQDPARRARVEDALQPAAEKAKAARYRAARRTAATRVDFLTLARGED
ncbi:phosphonate C-P lyase system protein PhnG [Methylobacterium pseudosasicola]|uniref:Alpha-D-ribose 1-methylphosphonate 5-triphosphate synthase subunit PhnG n=1 Tax=Methylobacterium pseudosasicola TaxID=582667 RepID=A0A1I4F3J1_9HYPH|nr:phosphonate C-P lyase system protein PhnG [Methylobacterium pseudosasicola]SFL11326.1 alpha-D-ribose 1-methylphosphonate 5-triphosphate synthase subunit PhnG [Methylobacterium pseudosasicola]